MKSGLKSWGTVAISVVATAGAIFFGRALYHEVQEHALRTFGAGVVFAGLAAIFGGILLWKLWKCCPNFEELKALVNSLGKKLETAETERAKASAALVDLKKATDEAAKKADDLAKKADELAKELADVKKLVTPPAPPAAPPALPTPAPKPSTADLLPKLIESMTTLGAIVTAYVEAEASEAAARTAAKTELTKATDGLVAALKPLATP